MKKHLIGIFTVAIVTLFSGVTHAQWRMSKNNYKINNSAAKDPLCKKYIKFRPVMGGNFNPLFYFKEPAKTLAHYRNSCSKSLVSCSAGWNAAGGKPTPGVKEFMKDSLQVVKWSGFWQFKFQIVDGNVGPRAMFGSILYNVPNAADLIAKSISTRERFQNIWGGPKHSGHVRKPGMLPYLALYYLGAKDKVDMMIDNLAVGGHHQFHFLTFAHFWNLTKTQKKKIEGTCLKILAKSKRNQMQARACMRYLAHTGTRNSDVIEYMMMNAGSGSSYLANDAVRALGILKVKKARRQIKSRLKSGTVKRTMRIRRRRRYRRKKMTTYTGNADVVSAAIALASMGDRGGKRAIKYWLSMKSNGPMDTRGFEVFLWEATLASRAMKKRLAKQIRKAARKLKKHSGSTNEDLYRAANVALLQMGSKAGLRNVLQVLGGHDKGDIKETLQQLGGMLTPLSYRRRGAQRIPVGKGGLRVSDAKKLRKLIKRRIRFWSDKRVKKYATIVILELTGAINAASA